MDDRYWKLNRRNLFRMIGLVAGGSVMYQAMTSLSHAADSQYPGKIKLQGAPMGAKAHFGNLFRQKVLADQVKGLRSMAH